MKPRSFFLSIVFAVVCFASALHAQDFAEGNHASTTRGIPPTLTCSPAPCRLPNTRVSRGMQTFVTPHNIAVNPNDSLQMVTGLEDKGCKSEGAAYGTSDEGSTWTRSCLPFLDLIDVDGVPRMVYDNHGIVHAIVTLFNLDDGADDTYETHSSDNGITWSPLILVVKDIGSFAYVDSAAVDNNPSSPFANTIYASVTLYLNNLDVEIVVARSTDGGATWKKSVAATLPKTQGLNSEGFGNLAIGKDGTVYMAYMATPDGVFTPNKMVLVKSPDGGQTWRTPVQVFSATAVGTIPNTSIYNPDRPVLAIDNSPSGAGRLYMTFYNWTGTFMQVLVTQSADGGNTWSTPLPVAPASDTHDQFLSWVSVSSTGIAAVTWLDRRDDPANVNYRTYAAISRSGVFTKNLALATGASQPPAYGVDFATSIWVGSTLYSIWPDTRSAGTLQAVLGGFIQ